MTARASILLWSAGSGFLLGLFADALLVALWLILSAIIPALGRVSLPRWAGVAVALFLVALPVVAAILGALEGKLKTT
jgi:hypothetical protein